MALRYHELVLPGNVKDCLHQKNVLSAFHLNIRSITKQWWQCWLSLSSIKIHVSCDNVFRIVVSSWRWRTKFDRLRTLLFKSPWWTGCRRFRIYLRNDIHCEILSAFTESNCDYEVLTLKCEQYLISVAYVPPSAPLQDSQSFLDRYFNFALASNYFLILGGDFNIDISHE